MDQRAPRARGACALRVEPSGVTRALVIEARAPTGTGELTRGDCELTRGDGTDELTRGNCELTRGDCAEPTRCDCVPGVGLKSLNHVNQIKSDYLYYVQSALQLLYPIRAHQKLLGVL